jgi:hypothetical protein
MVMQAPAFYLHRTIQMQLSLLKLTGRKTGTQYQPVVLLYIYR